MTSELPQTLSPALPAGHLLKEYSLLSVLGMGAFGITYLAADNYLHLKVAIKEYFPSNAAVRNHFSGSVALKSEKAQAEYLWGKERFMREAQTLARFHHKNIVQVFRYFEGNGTCYMVMAYEEGKSLEQVLDEGTVRWDEQATLALVMPLLDGLESVHAAGFLHRDIKPGNIVLRSQDDGPVLIDFGAARSPASTDALTVVLSHGYGPPEQYSRQGNQGPWTDIYAMAGVLYKIVTGVVPPLSIHRIKSDVMVPAAFSGEGRFSAGFLGAIDLALTVDETRRPKSIGEWRQLLTRGASTGESVIAPANGVDRNGVRTGGSGAADAGIRSSPSLGPGAVAPAARPGRIPRIEQASEQGLLGRLGQAMIAHPFLTLLLLLASIVSALLVTRRLNSPERPARPAVPVTAPGPSLVEGQNPSDSEPASRSGASDSERRRGPSAEAFTACAGKGRRASCSFIDARNESFTGICVLPPGGAQGPFGTSLVCRPEKAGERVTRAPGSRPNRQDTDQNFTDVRPSR